MGRIAGVTADETKERLLRAAMDVFALKGYEGATIADIAREAGLSTGAIYAHYRSKAELLIEAMHAHRAEVTAALFPPGSRKGAHQVLTTLGRRLNRGDEDARSLLAEAVLAARRDAELAQVLSVAVAESEAGTARLLRQGQAAGQLDGDLSADVVARFALMLGLGAMLVRSLDLPPTDAKEWSALVDRLVDSLTPGESA